MPVKHFSERTVGSGHATLALRADWQRQLRQCQKELGFRHVRFHVDPRSREIANVTCGPNSVKLMSKERS